MRILITGVSGFVGRHLASRLLQQNDAVVAGTGRATNRPEHLPAQVQYMPLDLLHPVAVLDVVTAFQPHIVIHSAAMSKPNDCEEQQALCYAVNVQATQHVIEACKACNCRLLFMSTDFVFGDDGPFAEDDAYNAVNYYGQSKVLAEGLVKNSGLPWSIVRTVLVYGPQLPGLNPTFPQWVWGNLKEGKTIRVFTDQYRTATYVADLTEGITSIVVQKATGVFHLCGEETFTPFDIAQLVAAHGGFDAQLVQPVTRAAFAEPARRPIRSTLHIAKAKSELGYAPRSLSQVLPLLF